MSQPIRVGLVGLSSQIGLGGGSSDWAGSAHLEYLLASPKYELVALANSSIESAQRSIRDRKLDSSIKAYGSVQDLVKDPDVDLVVISVQVQKHYELAVPALEAGKDVYVEWPLGVNTQEAEKLTRLATENGVRTIIGAQGRQNTFITKMKEIIDRGDIGKVKSTTVVAQWPPLFADDEFLKGFEVYLDQKSGANEFTIQFGHCM
jgi:predicted dehydrogenase